MNSYGSRRILGIREHDSALFSCELSAASNSELRDSLLDYRQTRASLCPPQRESADLWYFGENFEPFSPDSTALAEYLRTMESLIRSGTPVVIRSASPLLLIASPLLRQPNVDVVFLLEAANRDSRKAREALSALRALSRVGVRCWTLSRARRGSAPTALERALMEAGIHRLSSGKDSDILSWFQTVAIGKEQRSAA